MQPTQILLNNLLYDVSEVTIPTDNVDEEYIEKPKRLDISFVRSFMLYFGPISSIFDFLTFFVMISIFHTNVMNSQGKFPLKGEFQAAWFVESLCTQTLVIFVIRTRVMPFWNSRPSRLLTASTLLIVVIACILPFTALGAIFGFVPPPPAFFAALAGLVIGYIAIVELVKRWFYRRYAGMISQQPGATGSG